MLECLPRDLMDVIGDRSESGLGSSLESGISNFSGHHPGPNYLLQVLQAPEMVETVHRPFFTPSPPSSSPPQILLEASPLSSSLGAAARSTSCTPTSLPEVTPPLVGQQCPTHRQELRFLCIECSVHLCRSCTVTNHKDCLFKASPRFVRKLASQMLEEKWNYYENLKTTIHANENVFTKRYDNIKLNINECCNQLHVMVEERKSVLLKTLDAAQSQKNAIWQEHLGIINSAMDNIIELQGNIDKFTTFKDINREREKISHNDTELKKITDDNITFNFTRASTDAIGRIGEIHLSPSPSCSTIITGTRGGLQVNNYCIVEVHDSLNQRFRSGGHLVTANLTDKFEKSVELVVEDLHNGTYQVNYFPTKEGLYTMSVFLEGVAIRGSPFSIDVRRVDAYRNIFGPRCSFGDQGEEAGQFCRPWGICCDEDGRIIVADRSNHRVQIFSEEGQFLFSFGKEGSNPGEFLRPSGVATNSRGEIIVCDKDNHRIQVFNNNGKPIFQFGEFGTNSGQFNYPWDVSVNSNFQIIVSDSKNHRLQLFSEKGVFLKKYGFQESPLQWRRFDTPRGVAFHPNGDLLVTDFNNHRVVVLDGELKDKMFFGREGSNVSEFLRPQGIAVDDKGRFAVADSKNYRVQVFEPDGRLISFFGFKGSLPGAFDCPQGVCFTKSGGIAVVDMNNSRVQIF